VPRFGVVELQLEAAVARRASCHDWAMSGLKGGDAADPGPIGSRRARQGV